MIKRYLEKVTAKEREFNFTDLESLTDLVIGGKTDKDSLKKGKNYLQIGKIEVFDSEAINGFFDDEVLYLYTLDGSLRRIENGKQNLVAVSAFLSIPQFFYGVREGEKTLFAIDKDGCAVEMNSSISFTKFPCGESYGYYKGRIYSVEDKKITFTSLEDKDYSHCLMNTSISLPLDSERIFGVINLTEKLLIVTKSGLYLLTDGIECEDYKLSKIKCQTLSVEKGSVAQEEGKAYFISNGTLYEYLNGKITELSKLLIDKDFMVKGCAFCKNGIYAVKVELEETEYFLVCLTNENKSFFLPAEDKELIGGGVFISKSGEIFSLSDKGSGEFGWLSKKLDLDCSKEKILYGLEIYSEYPSIISLYGDFGKVSYSLKKGFNYLSFNLKTQTLRVEIIASKKKGEINSLKINYRV